MTMNDDDWKQREIERDHAALERAGWTRQPPVGAVVHDLEMAAWLIEGLITPLQQMAEQGNAEAKDVVVRSEAHLSRWRAAYNLRTVTEAASDLGVSVESETVPVATQSRLVVFQGAGYDWAPGEPRVDFNSRDSIIRWLMWNDPNGGYTDQAAEYEGVDPLTLDDARECMVSAWQDADGSPITFPFQLAAKSE